MAGAAVSPVSCPVSRFPCPMHIIIPWPPWLPERPRMKSHPKAIMPTIIRGQTSNSSSIGIPIAHSIACSFLGPPGVCLALSPIRYLVQLHQLADHLVLATVADAGGGAGVEG